MYSTLGQTYTYVGTTPILNEELGPMHIRHLARSLPNFPLYTIGSYLQCLVYCTQIHSNCRIDEFHTRTLALEANDAYTLLTDINIVLNI